MSNRPKILHLNTVADIRNGVGGIVMSLAKYASDYGMIARVFSGYGNSQGSHYVAQGRLRYCLNVFKCRCGGDDGFLKSTTTQRLNRLIAAEKPDLIHLHNLHGYYCDLPSLKAAITELGVPVVVTMHDLWLATGRCAYPSDDCIERHVDCKKCTERSRYPATWLGRNSRKDEKSDFLSGMNVVVPSRWMAKRVQQLIGINPLIIPNGVNKNIFNINEAGITERKKQLLAVATKWNNVKGVDDLICLAEKLPHDWNIVMVGKNVPKHPKIAKTGYIDSREAMAKLMKESAAIVSAARHEAYGMAVAEALSAGTPAIVRRATAPAEFLPDIRFAVDFSKPEKVVALLDLLDEYQMADTILSDQDMAERYFELYKSLLEHEP